MVPRPLGRRRHTSTPLSPSNELYTLSSNVITGDEIKIGAGSNNYIEYYTYTT